jgi:hypothetical protein
MDLSRDVLADPGASVEDRAEAETMIAETEARIRRAAAAQVRETWPAHLAYMGKVWAGPGYNDVGEFVPSVIGWDYHGLAATRVMERRRALPE